MPVNILIIKTSAIGDVTHLLPSLTALRRHYPDASITWLVEEAAADIIAGHSALDRVLVSRRKSWSRYLRRFRIVKFVREFHGFVKELRDTQYDLLVDFQASMKSSPWVVLARANRKAGYDRGMYHSEFSYLFLNKRIPPIEDMKWHAVERELNLLEGLGVPRGPVVFDFPLADEDEAEAVALLRENGITERDCLVAIHPEARWRTKLWENTRFGEVADRLIGEGAHVVFTGGPGDRQAIDEICSQMTCRAARLDGKTSLKTLAAIYRNSRVVLSTDTGPVHIAAAIGTPVVALFGPTAPWRTGPWGEQHTILRSEVKCSPCFKKRCLTREYEEKACLRRITVDQVVEAVLEKVAATC